MLESSDKVHNVKFIKNTQHLMTISTLIALSVIPLCSSKCKLNSEDEDDGVFLYSEF